LAYKSGAFGVALSGAGPTLLCFCEKGKGQKLQQDLQGLLPEMTVKQLLIDDTGSRVYKLEQCR